eukprot:gene2126-2445_t
MNGGGTLTLDAGTAGEGPAADLVNAVVGPGVDLAVMGSAGDAGFSATAGPEAFAVELRVLVLVLLLLLPLVAVEDPTCPKDDVFVRCGVTDLATAAIVEVQPIVINQQQTQITPTYTWTISKSFTNGADTLALTIPVDGTGTASYRIVVTRTLQTQAVAVAGSFDLLNTNATAAASFAQPQLSFMPGMGGVNSQTVCTPSGVIPAGGRATCTFTASWTDTNIMAASGGTVTVTVISNDDSSTSTQIQSYSPGLADTGSSATVSDEFTGGDITDSNVQISGNRPSGIPIRDSSEYSYTVTFLNFGSFTCVRPLTAANTASLRVAGQANTLTDSATATITLTGCQGASVTVGKIQTTVINSYSWALTKTGGGSGLRTTPDAELSIPFTVTATQTLTTSVGYIAGTVSVQNTAGSTTTITGLTITAGSQPPVTIPVSACSSTTLSGKGTTAACTFNVTDPSAPSAGAVTATVTLSGGTTATSDSQSYDYQTASTFDIGGTANIYDTVNQQSLTSLSQTPNSAGGAQGLIRFEPADQRPPSAAPGLSIAGSRTFQYNLIVSRLFQCTNDITNVQLWSAVTYSWSISKTASPNLIQLQPGQGGTANYQVQLTRNFQSGNYFMSGTLLIQNSATFPMYVTSVALVSSTGQFGALPTNCLGGSNVNSAVSPGSQFNPTNSFILAAGAQINCLFNVSAGTGSPMVGNVYATASINTGFVSSSVGNTAFSTNLPVDFNSVNQKWEIGGCVLLSDSATTTGSAGTYVPQLTGLPNQVQITNNAVAVPQGGGSTGNLQSSATVQVVVTGCQSPSPSPTPVPPPIGPVPPVGPVPGPIAGAQPLTVTISPGLTVSSAGSYQWTVTLSNNAIDAITVPYSGTQTVTYTVTAQRAAPLSAANTVSGQITLSNPNPTPVAVTAVTASAVGADTPAAADCAGQTSVAAQGTITCSFKLGLTSTASGQVTATVVSSAGTSTSPQPASFGLAAGNAADGQGQLGACAVITDSFQRPNAILDGALVLTGNRPADGTPIQVCEDTTYTFTAVFGPFKATDCNQYPVPVTATVTPQNGPQALTPAVATNVLQMTIDNCPGAVLSATDVTAVVNPLSVSATTTYEWVATTSAVVFNVNLPYTETGEVQFNVSYDKVLRVSNTLTGTVTVSNPTEDIVSIKSVTVEPELAVGALSSIPEVEASCKDTTLSPKESTTCSYRATSQATGRGQITATVTLTDGSGTTSAPTPFNLRTPTRAAPAGADVCIEVIGGLMLSTALIQPGAAKAQPADIFQTCEPGSKLYTQPVGPFQENMCGKYTMASISRIRPLNGTQLPFASISPVVLQVKDCPLTVTPKPAATIGPSLIPTNVVSHSWTLSKTSNLTGDTLNIPQYNQPKVVEVASLSRTGDLIIANATCPESSLDAGMITVPASPGKLQCSFKLTGLSPMDGAVVAVVYPERKSASPLPTDAAVWRVAGAKREVQGDCSTFGASGSLVNTATGAIVQGQPVRQGANFPSTPVCQSTSITYTLTFGPFRSNQCGKYRFDSDLSTDLVNTPSWETTDLDFNVVVQGCQTLRGRR